MPKKKTTAAGWTKPPGSTVFGSYDVTCANCKQYFALPVMDKTIKNIQRVQQAWSDLINRVGYFVCKKCVGPTWFGQEKKDA